MGYRVKTASAVAYQQDGSQVIRYQGQALPDSVTKDEMKRLEEGGFIEAVGSPQVSAENDEKAPAKSASKEEWVAYAESRGDDAAADKTKEQLIADHGEK